jgi:hypothetical protein
MATPYRQQARAGAEYLLPKNLTLRTDYLFVHGVKLPRTLNVNLLPPVVLTLAITLNKHDFTVIGVAPKDFASPFAARTRCVDPVTMKDYEARPYFSLPGRGSRWLMAMGRLKPGFKVPQAQANIAAIAGHLELWCIAIHFCATKSRGTRVLHPRSARCACIGIRQSFRLATKTSPSSPRIRL